MAEPLKAPFPCEATFRLLAHLPGYLIGDDGSVWSQLTGRFLRPYSDGGGYQTLKLRAGGKSVSLKVHCLVAEAFIGPRPVGMDVCHSDGDRRNNRSSNLRYDTRSGNLADRDRHGTHQRGDRNPAAKLTDGEAAAIREMRRAGRPLKEVAARFRVRESTVSRIANGVRRREVEGA